MAGRGRRVRLIEYDPDADVLTVNLRPGSRIAEDQLLDDDIIVSLDEKGEVVQVLDASRRGLLEALRDLYQARRALLQLLTGPAAEGAKAAGEA